MRSLKLILASIMIIAISLSASGQIRDLKKMGKKIEKKTEKAVDRQVDKKVDKTIRTAEKELEGSGDTPPKTTASSDGSDEVTSPASSSGRIIYVSKKMVITGMMDQKDHL